MKRYRVENTTKEISSPPPQPKTPTTPEPSEKFAITSTPQPTTKSTNTLVGKCIEQKKPKNTTMVEPANDGRRRKTRPKTYENILMKNLLTGEDVKRNENFTVENGYTVVYTDGSCQGNRKAGCKAGLGVFWGNGNT